jgi:hypothetical protein
MIAMFRVSRVRLVLVLVALIVLSVVPMAGARAVNSPSVHPADSGWIGAAVRWVEDLAGLNRPVHHGRSGAPTVVNTKMDDSVTGTCIDPMGRPRPCPGT